jgi:alpha-L-fucosidase
MKKTKIFFAFLIALTFSQAFTQQKGDEDAAMYNQTKKRDQIAIDEAVNGWWTKSMRTSEKRIEWWQDARFGMFVHWGIYSLPGGEWKGKQVDGYAEHLMRKEKIYRADYLDLAHQFNPVNFNADEWISTAKKAGMRYFVITAKHHDGFAMYDSKVSDFTITKQSPFKRDPLAELAQACKKQGIKFGFYYSHAFDWEHPDAPGNDWEYHNPGGDSLLFGGRNWFDFHPELLPKAIKYVDEKAIPQIKELLLTYHPDIIWFDTPHKLPLSENLRILKAIRETDPNVVVNGRLARTSNYLFGDYLNTGDRPAEFRPVVGNWEGIPTTNESYGYSKFDMSHKSGGFFIQLLAKAASRGGNTLMNIGPMGNGAFDPKDVAILKIIGNWMDVNSESIYGTNRSPLALQNWGVCTQRNDKLYLHVFDYPTNGNLIIGGLKSNIKNAYLLSDKSKKPLQIKRINPLDVSLKLPIIAPDKVNSVVVLETVTPIVADSVRLLSENSPNRLLVFDAETIGKGFGYGDGKINRYNVSGWKKIDQKLRWKLRLNKPTNFTMSLKYIGSKSSEGAFKITSGQSISKEYNVVAQKKEGEIITLDLEIMKLPGGTENLVIEPVKITKSDLMQMLEMTLTPVK